ncbi:MAG TPA: O-methyltransferase [Bacteroidales bacterium]|nr:O-methyltransferase [Bacteroidales bacterium]
MENATEAYCEAFSTPEDPVLRAIYRDTQLHQPFPRMISGHLQGMLLQMISRMLRPERVLELGCFTAYSAICLAIGLKEGGLLDTVEVNAELEDVIRANIRVAGMEDRILLHTGDARELIRQGRLQGPYDLVFIDGDKEQYPEYYTLVFDLVRTGGYILADNVLWGGKVLEEVKTSDKETGGIHLFNTMVRQDARVVQLLLPVRDGLMIIRKLDQPTLKG